MAGSEELFHFVAGVLDSAEILFVMVALFGSTFHGFAARVSGYTRQTKGQNYADPVLQEAVVTLFISQEQHDLSLPGRLLIDLPDLFSKSRFHQNPFWEGLHSDPWGQTVHPLVRLMNEAENFFLQYAQGALSLHSLKPYGGFQHLKSTCRRVVDYIRKSDETFTIDDCSLLYLNIFRFKEETVTLPGLLFFEAQRPGFGWSSAGRI